MKFVTMLMCSLVAVPAFAQEITSPFYLPEMGHILNQTSFDYTKKKRTPLTTRLNQQTLSDKVTVGLGAGLAATLEGDLNWTRQKQQESVSYPHTKTYAAGMKGQWEIGGLLSQLNVAYHQTTNVHFNPRRLIQTDAYFGKKLASMTPYIHLSGAFPMNARKDFNTPLYRGETGVFQSVKPQITLDTALFLQYDKNLKERSYGIRGEIAYLFTSWASVGLNGQWQARGHAKEDTNTYRQDIGVNIKLAF